MKAVRVIVRFSTKILSRIVVNCSRENGFGHYT